MAPAGLEGIPSGPAGALLFIHPGVFEASSMGPGKERNASPASMPPFGPWTCLPRMPLGVFVGIPRFLTRQPISFAVQIHLRKNANEFEWTLKWI